MGIVDGNKIIQEKLKDIEALKTRTITTVGHDNAPMKSSNGLTTDKKKLSDVDWNKYNPTTNASCWTTSAASKPTADAAPNTVSAISTTVATESTGYFTSNFSAILRFIGWLDSGNVPTT